MHCVTRHTNNTNPITYKIGLVGRGISAVLVSSNKGVYLPTFSIEVTVLNSASYKRRGIVILND